MEKESCIFEAWSGIDDKCLCLKTFYGNFLRLDDKVWKVKAIRADQKQIAV